MVCLTQLFIKAKKCKRIEINTDLLWKPHGSSLIIIVCWYADSTLDSPHDAVLIDSLLSIEQYRGAERSATGADGKPAKDIAEVAAATDLILPKGSARTALTVSLFYKSWS